MSDNSELQPVATFRRVGPKNKNAIRKRERKESSSNSDNDQVEAVTSTVDKRIAKKKSKMLQSTRKRQDISESTSESSDDETNSKFDINVKYSSSGVNKEGPSDMGATARSEHDTEHHRDAQSQFERIQKQLAEEDDQQNGPNKEKIYKGQAMYGASLKADTAKGKASSGYNRVGPIRATQYMRSTVRWDYAPDICKDYKETGFCTFGDSCKFLHDRSDYKHGWELERDWEQGKLNEAKDDEYLISSDDDNDEDGLPFACHICREDFKEPIVTKCDHYFCEKCAMQKCKIKCVICGNKTNGQFKIAKNLLQKIKEKKEKQKAEEEENEFGSEDDDELPPEAEMENVQEGDGSNSDDDNVDNKDS